MLQPKEVQEELKGVPKEHLLWQVDGNLYGRQSAAAQYRDRLEEIITKELPSEQYDFKRGAIDACVYKCEKTGTVLIHDIDDFDICGPEKVLNDLLMVQFPKNGCTLKMGDGTPFCRKQDNIRVSWKCTIACKDGNGRTTASADRANADAAKSNAGRFAACKPKF